MTVIADYRAALKRLIAGNPNIVPKGGKINNDTVALEAGRSRGSIKKSRPEFRALIDEIQEAASKSRTSSPNEKLITASARIEGLTSELSALKKEHAALLSKFLSTLHYNYQLQQEVKRLGGSTNTIGVSVNLGQET
ncbi:hypothetical protein D9M70_559500 [compost metagenome]